MGRRESSLRPHAESVQHKPTLGVFKMVANAMFYSVNVIIENGNLKNHIMVNTLKMITAWKESSENCLT